MIAITKSARHMELLTIDNRMRSGDNSPLLILLSIVIGVVITIRF